MKRRFKVRVIAQPMPTNPTLPSNPTLSTEPTPTVATTIATTQMLVARTLATSGTVIPVTVYKLAQGKFKGIPYPTKRLQEEGPSTPSGNKPLVEQQPKAAVTATAPQKGTLHGLIPCQLPQTCLMLGHLGQFPQWMLPHLLRWKRQKKRFHPE